MKLLGTLKERGDPIQRVLRIGALSTLSRNFQIGFLRSLLHIENVEVIISSGRLNDLLQALEAHQLDVVLVNAPPARDAATPWISHQIADQPVSLIGTPQRLKRQKRAIEALLSRNPLVLPTGESNIRTGFDALPTGFTSNQRLSPKSMTWQCCACLHVRTSASRSSHPSWSRMNWQTDG